MRRIPMRGSIRRGRIFVAATAVALATASAGAQSVEEEIQKHLDLFALVPSATNPATNRLQAVSLNEHPLVVEGARIDGFRFVVPASEDRELQVGVDIPDNAEDRMEITPARGQIRHEFNGYVSENAWTKPAAAKVCPPGTRMVFFTVDARNLPPDGQGCVIWFVFRDDKPARIPVSVLFTKRGAGPKPTQQLPEGMLTDRKPLVAGMRFPQVVILPPTNTAGTDDPAFEERVVQALAGVLATNNHVLLGAERKQWLAEHHLATAADFRFERVNAAAKLAVPTISFLPYSNSGTPNSLGFHVYSSDSTGESNISEMKPVSDLISNKLRELMPLIDGFVDEMLAVPPALAERAAACHRLLQGMRPPSFSVSIKESGGAAKAQAALLAFLTASGCSATPGAGAASAEIDLVGAGSRRVLFTRDGMTASEGKVALKVRRRDTGAEAVLYQSAVVAGGSEDEAGRAALAEAAVQLAERLLGTCAK